MSSGDVRCSHSASFFKVTRRTEEEFNRKRLREKENTAPAILVDVPSAATLTEKSLEVINDLLPTGNKKKKHHIPSNKTQPFERQTGEICIAQKILNLLFCGRTCS